MRTNKATYNSMMGLAIMSGEPGKQTEMVVAICLPKEIADRLGDVIVKWLAENE